MIDRLETGLVQAEFLPTLLVAVLAIAGSVPAIAAVVGAAAADLRKIRGLIAGVSLGLTMWGAGTCVLLVAHPHLGFDGLAIALALVVAVFGGVLALMLLYPLEGEAGPLLAGATLAATAGGMSLILKAALFTIHALDPVVAVIAWVGATAVVAAGLMVARMRLGPSTIFAATAGFAIMLIVVRHGISEAVVLSGGAAAVQEAGLWPASELLVVVVALLATVPLIGAFSWVISIRSVERRLAVAEAEVERQKALAALLSDDAKVPMTALIGCLDFMASEPLPLVQRSRLDLARACAHEVDALLAGSVRLGAMAAAPATLAAEADTPPDVAVLVVDDAEMHRTVASAMLRRLGVHISVARDGEEALALLRDQPHDLVLMDIEMPRLGGFATTAAIRLDPDLKEIPVVGLSSDVAADREEALESGMDDIIAKPLSMERIAEALDRWCADRMPASARQPAKPDVPPSPPAHEIDRTVFWRGAAV